MGKRVLATVINKYTDPRLIMPGAVRGYNACLQLAAAELPHIETDMRAAKVFSVGVEDLLNIELDGLFAVRKWLAKMNALGPEQLRNDRAGHQTMADLLLMELDSPGEDPIRPIVPLAPLPFPHVFVGFRGQNDADFTAPWVTQVEEWTSHSIHEESDEAFAARIRSEPMEAIVGLLLSEDHAYAFTAAVASGHRAVWTGCEDLIGDGVGLTTPWGRGLESVFLKRNATSPFIRLLYATISNPKRVVVPALARRYDTRRVGGPLSIPRDFYTIDGVSSAQAKKAGRTLLAMLRRLAYRHDRRAHAAARVRRGPLPLSADLAAKLEKYGYTICIDEVPMDIEGLLADRGMCTKADDEWLAVKKWRVRNTVVGPEDLPYRPALRVTGGTP